MEMEDNSSVRNMKGAGIFFFLLMLFEIPVAVGVAKVQSFFPAEKATLVSVLITQGYLLVAALIYIWVTGKSFVKDLNVRKYKKSSFAISLLVLLCAFPFANWLNIFSQFFVKNETGKAVFEITENVPVWLGILIIGCLPGFVEETIYRGIIFSAFRKYSILTGVIISSVSFGLMHLNFNQMLYAIYLGIIFSFLVEATGSLVSTMVLHMLFNAFNTVYLYMLPMVLKYVQQHGLEKSGLTIEEVFNKTPSKAELISALTFFTPMAGIGLLLTILLIRKIAQINGRTLTWKSICEKNGDVNDKSPVNIWLVIGWCMCLVFSVINMLS